ncbi:MAG: thiamine phosphate synthase [Fastidiosipilaceae bacterium]|jgi:thiamine-phosphate pyrophosphorylase|nr:thiamine phosphate synthase [Clostridiaceae bacterium]
MRKNLDLTLYLITDSDVVAEPDFEDRLTACLENGVTIVQLREKHLSGREYLTRALAVKEICDRYDVPLIIDDRVDIALAADTAGVHVGSEDLPVATVRKILGPDKIVGATAKTVATAQAASADGADYVGTGAIYPTTTKVKTILTSVETLTDVACKTNIPVNAIGGLNIDNIDILKDTGIAGICVVTALMKAEDPAAMTRALRDKLRRLGIGKQNN